MREPAAEHRQQRGTTGKWVLAAVFTLAALAAYAGVIIRIGWFD